MSQTDAPTTVSYLQLLAGLPSGGVQGSASDAFAIPKLPEPFIAPTLRLEVSAEEPSVTFLSARGATGKSFFAAQVAAMKRVPLWRLDLDLGVSAHTLEANLSSYLGADGAQKFAADDNSFLVIDALDEARMRVSGLSWKQFIDSLVPFAQSGQKFVLLGRERIIEDVWLQLDDAGIGSRWLEISHFDQDQRTEYVNKQVAHRGGQADGEVYEQARDAVLSALAGTVDAELVDSFVGYAPVLDAVVALLAKGNHKVVLNTFGSELPAADRIGVLLQILDSLLVREQSKTGTSITELGLDAEQGYTPDEQLQWLASELLGGSQPSLEWCDSAKQVDYVSRVREFLQEHPFRSEDHWASPVFSAYVAARRFDDVSVRKWLQSVGSRTGLLFDFVTNEHDVELLDEWQFAALHASMLAAESREIEADVSVQESQAEGDLPDALAGDLMLVEANQTRRASFALALETEGVFEVLGPTAYLSVTFPGTVSVTAQGGSVSLGPETFVHCQQLRLRSDSVEVVRRARPQDDQHEHEPSVVLEVERSFEVEGSLTGPPTRDIFEIRVPDELTLVFPWVSFRSALPEPATKSDDRAERLLKMMMTLMRRHGHGGRMAVFDKKLQGRQSIKGGEFACAIGELEALGIVSYENVLIYLQPDWEQHWFSGKGREGLPTLEQNREVFASALERISACLGP